MAGSLTDIVYVLPREQETFIVLSKVFLIVGKDDEGLVKNVTELDS